MLLHCFSCRGALCAFKEHINELIAFFKPLMHTPSKEALVILRISVLKCDVKDSVVERESLCTPPTNQDDV